MERRTELLTVLKPMLDSPAHSAALSASHTTRSGAPCRKQGLRSKVESKVGPGLVRCA